MSCKNEHEKVKMSLCTGANAATDITCTGLAVGDTIVSVIDITTPAAVSLAGLAITAGKFQVTASTASKNLLVLWLDASAG